MDDDEQQNRKERRKQSKYFKLKKPDRSEPQGKTLLELAEERQKSLFEAADERQHELAQADQDEPIGPLGEAIVYTITMAMLHFTLDVLVHNQYNQYGEEIKWKPIFSRTAQAIPSS
ncbi:MAG: hypothetical protein M1813_005707 [Trichoglossum hirsutum]|nr:MAG: hypothetical protein M1813_005707 [Trichoglossum hirsutum]